jgi:hypothetical protein
MDATIIAHANDRGLCLSTHVERYATDEGTFRILHCCYLEYNHRATMHICGVVIDKVNDCVYTWPIKRTRED